MAKPTATPGVRAAVSLPVEGATRGSWLGRCVRTLVRMLVHPWSSLGPVAEPVPHARVLAYLATLRLPLWLGLLVLVASRTALSEAPQPIPLVPIHEWLSPELTRTLSVWWVVMVPVGLPVLYFTAGLLAHIGVALTGGAPRSIGATMRATGYALGPAMLVIGGMDLVLYSRSIGLTTVAAVVGLVVLQMLWCAGGTLARTHQISAIRGLLVAVVPALWLASLTLARAALVVDDIPGIEAPAQPYYVP